jgi:hypothetical protein
MMLTRTCYGRMSITMDVVGYAMPRSTPFAPRPSPQNYVLPLPAFDPDQHSYSLRSADGVTTRGRLQEPQIKNRVATTFPAAM